MIKILGTCFLLALAAQNLPAQGFVQISSIRAHPQKLICVGADGIGYVRVQVYMAGIDKATKQSTVTVELALYSTHQEES